MAHDLMRGIKNQNFWVMEQQCGPCGWQTLGNTPEPGQVRLWTYQSLAHGAEAIVYFRWRSPLHGTEQYWHGLLDHDGVGRRRYREIAALGKELAGLDDLLARETQARWRSSSPMTMPGATRRSRTAFPLTITGCCRRTIRVCGQPMLRWM